MPCRSTNEQFRVNRRAARVAVKIRQLGPHTAQIDKAINRSQQVGLWDMIFQRKRKKQCRLRFLFRSHHRSISYLNKEIESATYAPIKE